MNTLQMLEGLALLAILMAATLAYLFFIRSRQMHRWAGSYFFTSEKRPDWSEDDEVDVFIAICDHWEPRCYGASDEKAIQRVARWRDEYPERFAQFHDVNGRVPLHSIFFPEDEYRPEYLDEIRSLVDNKFADVDIHLHHHNDTAEQLHEKLANFRDTLFHRHGYLRKDPVTGEIVYGFIHGNWALCNSRPDGQCCGVDQELTVLLQTGCYADFTLPSAPSATQIKTINSIYYAKDIPGQRASHRSGIRARVGQQSPADHLLMVQGALLPDWQRRRLGVIPRTENSDLHQGRPGDLHRLKLWMKAGVHVAGRPDWRFVKLHAHGCKDGNIDTMLGQEMQTFHQQLQDFHVQHPNFRYHYVSAWEMAQLVHQAEAGLTRPNLSAIEAGVPASLATR